MEHVEGHATDQSQVFRRVVAVGATGIHPTLCEDVQLWLDVEAVCGRLPAQDTVEKDHGRIEIRRYALSDRIDWLDARPD